jgi:hypothetical protein
MTADGTAPVSDTEATPVSDSERAGVRSTNLAGDLGERTLPAADAMPGPHPMRTEKLDIFYSKHHAVEGIDLTFPRNTVTALIGPSGCGKSTYIRALNRMHELIPGATVQGKVWLRDTDIYSGEADPVAVRRAVGMVFQRPNPFPTKSIADNIRSGPKFNRLKLSRDEKDHLVEKTLRGAGLWDEVKNRLDRRPVRRPAAAPVHRPGARGGARGAPHGRALLGARPAVDAADRGPDPGAQGAAHDRDRDPQHAAGRPRVGLHRVLHHRERG